MPKKKQDNEYKVLKKIEVLVGGRIYSYEIGKYNVEDINIIDGYPTISISYRDGSSTKKIAFSKSSQFKFDELIIKENDQDGFSDWKNNNGFQSYCED